MGYRDELQAARDRNDALEQELEEARAHIQQLEHPPAPIAAPIAAPKPAEPFAPRMRVDVRTTRVGRIFFHRPANLWPLFVLFAAGVRATVARAPYAPAPDTDRVITWVLQALVWRPFVYVVRWPLYWVSIAIALPVALVVCILGSFVLLPIVALGGLTFSPNAPSDRGWLVGGASEEQGAMFLWILMSIIMQPLLLTTTSLLTEREP